MFFFHFYVDFSIIQCECSMCRLLIFAPTPLPRRLAIIFLKHISGFHTAYWPQVALLNETRGRIQEFILGGQTKVPNLKLPESRAQSARVSRAKYRGRSPSRGREAPENWGGSPNRGRSPKKSGGRGLGRGLGEPLPRKFLKNQTWNHSFWCIFEAVIWND